MNKTGVALSVVMYCSGGLSSSGKSGRDKDYTAKSLSNTATVWGIKCHARPTGARSPGLCEVAECIPQGGAAGMTIMVNSGRSPGGSFTRVRNVRC